MKAADAHPAVNRDLLKEHNNMWSYPKNLDPELEPKAHIYGEGVTKEVKKSEDDQKDKDTKAKEEGKAAVETKKKDGGATDGNSGNDGQPPEDSAGQTEVKNAD
jgi:hypothetical protein